MLGTGEWTVQVARRGGSPILFEVAWSAISTTRPINSIGQAQVNLPGGAGYACEVLTQTEPWRDELLIYRDDYLAFVGPVMNVEANLEGGTITVQDLSIWLENRFFDEDVHYSDDIADVFGDIVKTALEADDSSGLTVSTRTAGIPITRDFVGADFTRIADTLRELARTGMDYCMVGRRLCAAGELNDLLGGGVFHLTDDAILEVTLTKEGETLATDIGILGAALVANQPPVNGRATRAVSVYGLVQKTFSELLIHDNLSADRNAEERLRILQPPPTRVEAILTPRAAVSFSELHPGRKSKVGLFEAAGCLQVDEEMRVIEVTTQVESSENGVVERVGATLLPVGIANLREGV